VSALKHTLDAPPAGLMLSFRPHISKISALFSSELHILKGFVGITRLRRTWDVVSWRRWRQWRQQRRSESAVPLLFSLSPQSAIFIDPCFSSKAPSSELSSLLRPGFSVHTYESRLEFAFSRNASNERPTSENTTCRVSKKKNNNFIL